MKTYSRAALSVSILFCIGCREEVVRGLDDSEARKVVAVLDSEGIESVRQKLSDTRWSIWVDRAEVLRAIRTIEDFRLARNLEPPEPPSSLFLSDSEQQARLERMSAGRMELMLRTVDGVLDAKVLLHTPRPSPTALREAAPRGSASVLIIASPKFALSRDEVANLVAGGAGLTSDNIQVLVKPATVSTSHKASAENDSAPPPADFPARAYSLLAGLAAAITGAAMLRRVFFHRNSGNEPLRS